jgi:predicted RNA-binding protein with TRAM domain
MTDDLLTLRVEKLSSHGEGIAFSEGKAVFIPYSIPGELVFCRIVEDHASFSRAELIGTKEPSPHRSEPLCPLSAYAGLRPPAHRICLPNKTQTGRARETFQRIGGFDPASSISSPESPITTATELKSTPVATEGSALQKPVRPRP